MYSRIVSHKFLHSLRIKAMTLVLLVAKRQDSRRGDVSGWTHLYWSNNVFNSTGDDPSRIPVTVSSLSIAWKPLCMLFLAVPKGLHFIKMLFYVAIFFSFLILYIIRNVFVLTPSHFVVMSQPFYEVLSFLVHTVFADILLSRFTHPLVIPKLQDFS